MHTDIHNTVSSAVKYINLIILYMQLTACAKTNYFIVSWEMWVHISIHSLEVEFSMQVYVSCATKSFNSRQSHYFLSLWCCQCKPHSKLHYIFNASFLNFFQIIIHYILIKNFNFKSFQYSSHLPSHNSE